MGTEIIKVLHGPEPEENELKLVLRFGGEDPFTVFVEKTDDGIEEFLDFFRQTIREHAQLFTVPKHVDPSTLRHRATARDMPPTPGYENASAPQPRGPDGQYGDHWVLPKEERKKGHVRPVRRTYKHLKCGHTTTMGTSIAETYARDPGYYTRTFCCACSDYFPVGADGEFVWEGTEEKVGT